MDGASGTVSTAVRLKFKHPGAGGKGTFRARSGDGTSRCRAWAPAAVQLRRHIAERIRDEATGCSLGPMKLSRYRNRETTATNGRKRAAVEIRERRRGGFFASPVRGSPSASARDRPEWKDLLSSPGKLVGPFCRNYSPGNQWWRVGASREIPSEVSPPGRTFETCR